MRSKIVFLTHQFYVDHPNPPFVEIEQKENRPYIVFLLEIEGRTWALPFRSNIGHRYAYLTDEEHGCGIDYTKAVVVEDTKYIDADRTPHLRQNEFEALRGNEHLVYRGFARYIKEYKKAKRSGNARYTAMLKYSTLQNYEL